MSWIVSCVTGSHHASECLLDVRALGALQNRLEQQWILGDPLMWFGLHVAQPHPLALRVSLHPLDMQTWSYEQLFNPKTGRNLSLATISEGFSANY